jgi:hypothetical protein
MVLKDLFFSFFVFYNKKLIFNKLITIKLMTIKTKVIIGLICLLLLCSSSEAIYTEQEPTIQNGIVIYAKIFLFGRIDGWYWQNFSNLSWLTLNGSDYRVIGHIKMTSSNWYKYGVVRHGWSYAFANFHFKGTLTQKFVCGMFYSGNVSENLEPKIKTLGLFRYSSIEFIKGEIDGLTVNGEYYDFYAKNLTAIKFWRIKRSWGFDIVDGHDNDIFYRRYINTFHGTIEPTYIQGYFLTTYEGN